MFFVNVNLSEKTQVTFFNVLVRVSLKLIKNVFRVCLPIFFYSDRVTDSPPYKGGGGRLQKTKSQRGGNGGISWVACVLCDAHF